MHFRVKVAVQVVRGEAGKSESSNGLGGCDEDGCDDSACPAARYDVAGFDDSWRQRDRNLTPLQFNIVDNR